MWFSSTTLPGLYKVLLGEEERGGGGRKGKDPVSLSASQDLSG